MSATLKELGHFNESGDALFSVAASPDGELVLCPPTGSLGEELRELDSAERVRLAALSSERPALVVESAAGDYVVLLDRSVDLDKHVPLAPADTELIASTNARARFGRRDDDVLVLTPWAEEDDAVLFRPDRDEFADVPLVQLDDKGDLSVQRGNVPSQTAAAARQELNRIGAEPGVPYGLLVNAFGDYACIQPGSALLPHEDVRRHTLLNLQHMLDGAGTLAEAARRLEGLASRFRDAEAAGWEVAHPVTDGLLLSERLAH